MDQSIASGQIAMLFIDDGRLAELGGDEASPLVCCDLWQAIKELAPHKAGQRGGADGADVAYDCMHAWAGHQGAGAAQGRRGGRAGRWSMSPTAACMHAWVAIDPRCAREATACAHTSLFITYVGRYRYLHHVVSIIMYGWWRVTSGRCPCLEAI